jgi:hypothetical protein
MDYIFEQDVERCPQCRIRDVVRLNRRGILDYLLSVVGRDPFQCPHCYKRFNRINDDRLGGDTPADAQINSSLARSYSSLPDNHLAPEKAIRMG